MTQKEIAELKKRLTKNGCTFTRMCGCYVDGEKNVLAHLSETFLALEDDEFYKYLDIAKKTLSGSSGNQLLTLSFTNDAEQPGEMAPFLLALRDSGLKDESLLALFYEKIIDGCGLEGNYLILLFHDAYDVISKTTDGDQLDESSEVFSYLLCAICPVSLSKAALGYREESHTFLSRIRDWVVEAPETGFLFPAFHDRSTDIHSLLFYTRNTKHPQTQWMTEILGVVPKQTATEQKETFRQIITDGLEESEEKAEAVFNEVQRTLSAVVEEHQSVFGDGQQEITAQEMEEILLDSGVAQEQAKQIGQTYASSFEDQLPEGTHLLDHRALAAAEQQQKEKHLMQQVSLLNRRLQELEEGEQPAASGTNRRLLLRLPADKAAQTTTQTLEGKRYVLIPLAETEEAIIEPIEKKESPSHQE